MNLRQGVTAAITTAVITVVVALGFHFGAVDTAGAPVSLAQAQELKANGVTLFVQALTWWPSCSHAATIPNTRVASLTNAQLAGMGIAGYFLVDSTLNGAEAVDLAVKDLPRELFDSLQFVAIDFEIPGECYAAGTRIPLSTVQEAADRLAQYGKPCVIYTSYGEWGSRMTPQDPPHPVGCYLWEASWDQNPDVDFTRHPFGAWSPEDIVLEQFNGGTSIANVYVDLDSLSIKPFPWLSPCVGGDPCWQPKDASWHFTSGWRYVPGTTDPCGDWFDPSDHHMFGACDPAWNGRYLPDREEWLHRGDYLYTHDTPYIVP